MNPIEIIENIENIVIIENENIENNIIIDNIINILNNLGPPPVLQRNNPPVYFGFEEAEDLIADAEFQCYDSPHDFVMPAPCSKCHWICCNEDCSLEQDEMPLVAKQLSFDEEMDLPPPPCLTRMLTNSHLSEDEMELPPLPRFLTRMLTSAHLSDDEEQNEEYPVPVPRSLSRMLTSAYFPEDEDEEQDEEQDDEQDQDQDK